MHSGGVFPSLTKSNHRDIGEIFGYSNQSQRKRLDLTFIYYCVGAVKVYLQALIVLVRLNHLICSTVLASPVPILYTLTNWTQLTSRPHGYRRSNLWKQ